MRKLYALIDRVSDTDVPVLITGESGTGKEVVARAVHIAGPRAKQPFLGVNCGAIPANLLESELFGHVRGAFTGADRDRKGLFREAENGTILLDEIGEMPQKMQAGLLRVLQEKTVRPVGGAKEEPCNARVIAATNRDLVAMVAEGTFREDLYYRLHVIELKVPPLRERAEDIPALIDHFLTLFAARHKRERKTVERTRRAPAPGLRLAGQRAPARARAAQRVAALGGATRSRSTTSTCRRRACAQRTSHRAAPRRRPRREPPARARASIERRSRTDAGRVSRRREGEDPRGAHAVQLEPRAGREDDRRPAADVLPATQGVRDRLSALSSCAMRLLSLVAVSLTLGLTLGCSKESAKSDPAATSSAGTSAAATAASGEVTVGKPPPDFSTKDHNGADLKLSALKGKPVVVYFYPKDETPGCTTEAKDFRDSWKELEKKGVVVIGISTDNADSHKAFAKHHELPFHLVSDEGGAIAKSFGVPNRMGFLGRQTFVIGADGNVKKICLPRNPMRFGTPNDLAMAPPSSLTRWKGSSWCLANALCESALSVEIRSRATPSFRAPSTSRESPSPRWCSPGSPSGRNRQQPACPWRGGPGRPRCNPRREVRRRLPDGDLTVRRSRLRWCPSRSRPGRTSPTPAPSEGGERE